MSVDRKRIVIIGATSAMAEHCARLWCKDSAVDLLLVGRNRLKTERIAEDLRVRNPKSNIRVIESNFTDPKSIHQLIDSIVAEGPVYTALIAHGVLSEQQDCQQNLDSCHEALIVNAISPVLFAEAFAKHMERANTGNIGIIGSVAGDRGRKSNYVYGSAKALVEKYAQGLQHRLEKSGVKVILVKPGPTDTPMTSHLKEQGVSLANVEDVARRIVSGIDKGKSVVYAPAKWGIIMLIIKNLPKFIFNKMDI